MLLENDDFQEAH